LLAGRQVLQILQITKGEIEMSGVKHTPGPWFNVADSYIHADYPNKNGQHIATVWANGGEKETVANAHLIAAAPELLEALLYFVLHGKDVVAYVASPEAYEKMTAAIAKATGQNEAEGIRQ
jgi:hypothetical protein